MWKIKMSQSRLFGFCEESATNYYKNNFSATKCNKNNSNNDKQHFCYVVAAINKLNKFSY